MSGVAPTESVAPSGTPPPAAPDEESAKSWVRWFVKWLVGLSVLGILSAAGLGFLVFFLIKDGSEIKVVDPSDPVEQLVIRCRKLIFKKIFWGRLNFKSLRYLGGLKFEIKSLEDPRRPGHVVLPWVVAEILPKSMSVRGQADLVAGAHISTEQGWGALRVTSSSFPCWLGLPIMNVWGRRLGKEAYYGIEPGEHKLEARLNPKLRPLPLDVTVARAEYSGAGELTVSGRGVAASSSVDVDLKIRDYQGVAPVYEKASISARVRPGEILVPDGGEAVPIMEELNLDLTAKGPSLRPSVAGKIRGSVASPLMSVDLLAEGLSYKAFRITTGTVEGDCSDKTPTRDSLMSSNISLRNVASVFVSDGHQLNLDARRVSLKTEFMDQWANPTIVGSFKLDKGSLRLSPVGKAQNSGDVSLSALLDGLMLEARIQWLGRGCQLTGKVPNFLGGPARGELYMCVAKVPTLCRYKFHFDGIKLEPLTKSLLGDRVLLDGTVGASIERTQKEEARVDPLLGSGKGEVKNLNIRCKPPAQGLQNLTQLVEGITFKSVKLTVPRVGDGIVLVGHGVEEAGSVELELRVSPALNVTGLLGFTLAPKTLSEHPEVQSILNGMGSTNTFFIVMTGPIGFVETTIVSTRPNSFKK